MSDQPHVPPTPVYPKRDGPSVMDAKLELVCDTLIGYAELVKAAAVYLENRKRLTDQQAFTFVVELRFIGNILKNMIGLPLEVVMDKSKQVVTNPKFPDEVALFADSVAPQQSLLVDPMRAQAEFAALRKAGKTSWNASTSKG